MTGTDPGYRCIVEQTLVHTMCCPRIHDIPEYRECGAWYNPQFHDISQYRRTLLRCNASALQGCYSGQCPPNLPAVPRKLGKGSRQQIEGSWADQLHLSWQLSLRLQLSWQTARERTAELAKYSGWHVAAQLICCSWADRLQPSHRFRSQSPCISCRSARFQHWLFIWQFGFSVHDPGSN